MNQRPTHSPEHADYRAKIIEADRAVERLLEGLRRQDPWALRAAAALERLSGEPRPRCECEDCVQAEGP